MSFIEKIRKILTLEDRKTEIRITILSLLVQTISVIIILSNNEFFKSLIFWVLLFLSIFLFLIIIFQFFSVEFTVESMTITLQFIPEYDGSINNLFTELNIPSVSIDNSNIIFETLNFSIQNNSNSLVIQTSQRTEKVISQLYGDLKVFRQKFEEAAFNSKNSTLKNLATYCEIDFKTSSIKTLKKNEARSQSQTFEQGLIINKTKDKIQIILPETCILKSWKELKKIMW